MKKNKILVAIAILAISVPLIVSAWEETTKATRDACATANGEHKVLGQTSQADCCNNACTALNPGAGDEIIGLCSQHCTG
jgi:type II secretory pathway pseudopilin PulG